MCDTVPSHRILDREIRLVRVLGAGSYGEVHLAEPIRTRSRSTFCYPDRIAVKILHRHLCGPEQATALRKELKVLQRLHHPCVVGYLGVWVEASSKQKHKGCHCLAMNYCDGGDLHGLLQTCLRDRQFLSVEVLIRLLACVFAGLNYSHAHRVIHRDIKPANVFLTVNTGATPAGQGPGHRIDRALIGDYGLARPLDKTMQLAKTRVGTPCYCSPEIVAGEAYSGKTDIFSAGVMFYELMAQESPFWRRTYTDVQCFYQILHHDPIPRLRDLCGGRYGSSLVEVVARCLSKEEASRPTAFEVLTRFSSRIQRALTVIGVPVYADKTHAETVPGESTSPTPTPAVAAAAAAAAAGEAEEVGPQRAPTPTRESATLRLLALMKREFPGVSDGSLAAVFASNAELSLLAGVLKTTRGEAMSALRETASPRTLQDVARREEQVLAQLPDLTRPGRSYTPEEVAAFVKYVRTASSGAPSGPA